MAGRRECAREGGLLVFSVITADGEGGSTVSSSQPSMLFKPEDEAGGPRRDRSTIQFPACRLDLLRGTTISTLTSYFCRLTSPCIPTMACGHFCDPWLGSLLESPKSETGVVPWSNCRYTGSEMPRIGMYE